jgi:hypothetical protein
MPAVTSYTVEGPATTTHSAPSSLGFLLFRRGWFRWIQTSPTWDDPDHAASHNDPPERPSTDRSWQFTLVDLVRTVKTLSVRTFKNSVRRSFSSTKHSKVLISGWKWMESSLASLIVRPSRPRGRGNGEQSLAGRIKRH